MDVSSVDGHDEEQVQAGPMHGPRRTGAWANQSARGKNCKVKYYRVYVACVRKLQVQSGQSGGATSASRHAMSVRAAPTVHAIGDTSAQSSSTRKLDFIIKHIMQRKYAGT